MKAEKVYETPKISNFDFIMLIVFLFWPPILFGFFWLVIEYGEVMDTIGTLMFNNVFSAFFIFGVILFFIYKRVRK